MGPLRKQARLLIILHSSLSRNVSIKIFRSDFKSNDYILSSLARLKSGPESHPGKKYMAQLMDHFELKGPNGHHLCLVHDALGKHVADGFPSPRAIWERAKQMVEAIAYVHEVGLVHGGESITRSSVMQSPSVTGRLCRLCSDVGYTRFRLSADFDPVAPEKELYGIQPVDESGDVAPVLASSLTPRVPRYLVPEDLDRGRPVKNDRANHLQMIGISCLESISGEQGMSDVPRYRAPEMLLDGQLNPKGDIWSLGYLVGH